MKIAEIQHLCKSYPQFRLQDVSFSMEAGRITGFIGRNGAGKTTTIKSMLGLVHPESGELRYFGLPFAENEAEIKSRIGYSTGTVNYYPHKKLGNIVAVTREFYANWDDAAYEEYRRMFALEENKTPAELSEGMKVKFNLLLALSHRAEILILDEPTSGLDPFSRDELLELFLELRDRGTAILYSTHITSDLEKCADDILYIRAGRIEAFSGREQFREGMSAAGETLEETFLRLEKEARHDG